MATETSYGRYIIKSRMEKGEGQARALRGKKMVGDIKLGATEDAAILAVKAALDAADAQQRSARVNDGYPTVIEVREALAAIKMTDAQRDMLDAHLRAPDHTLSAAELAKAGGYDSWVSSNSQYGALGHSLSDELGWVPPSNSKGTPSWTSTLATGVGTDNEIESEHWQWKLRPEVIEARQD